MSSCQHELPGDLVEEILMRLPAKHVLRCKLLSKPYYDLIKSPSFINKHLHYQSNSTTTNENIIHATSTSIATLACDVYIPHPDKFKKVHVILLGSCNGLLCAEISDPCSLERMLVLWNPATREHKILPSRTPFDYYGFGYYGFGYDAITDDYKLVVFDIGYNKSPSNAQLWSMRRNSWRDVEIGDAVVIKARHSVLFIDSPLGTCIGRNLYWLACEYDKPYSTCRDSNILVFDLVSNSFTQKVELPIDPPEWEITSPGVLVDFLGSLAFLTNWLAKFDVWVLQLDDDDNCKNYSWTRLLCLEPLSEEVMPTRISMNGEFLFRSKFYSYYYEDSKYFWYDHHNKEWKEFWCSFTPSDLLCLFNESLVPLNQPALQ